jgi:polyphosphate kinase 2 (PPK2 family)
MSAFEVAIEKCSSDASPWFIVPAENRNFRDVMIASTIRDALRELDPDYPEPEFDEAVYSSDSIS